MEYLNQKRQEPRALGLLGLSQRGRVIEFPKGYILYIMKISKLRELKSVYTGKMVFAKSLGWSPSAD